MIGFVVAILMLPAALNAASPLFTRTSDQYINDAIHQQLTAPVVHVAGKLAQGGHVFDVNVASNKLGDSQGSVGVDGVPPYQYRFAQGKAFAQGDQAYWDRKLGDDRLAKFLMTKWVVSSPTSLDFSLDALTREVLLLDVATPGSHPGLHKVGGTTIKGVRVVHLTDAAGDLYVTLSQPNRLVRVVSQIGYIAAGNVSRLNLDVDYPANLTVDTPAQAVDPNDPRQLPARFTYVADSFKFVNCDGPSVCQMSATVRNLRGQIVGDAHADFKLTKDADNSDLGSCTAPIKQVDYNQTEDITCTVSGSAWVAFARVGGRYRGEVSIHNSFYDG
jgi:hypothetical protein